MKKIFSEIRFALIFVLIVCIALFIIAGAQENVEPKNEEPAKVAEPAPKPVTHLKVILIDGINDKVFELKNCMVQIVGELNMCDNIFPYQKTFVNGNDYEITIMIKPKD